MITPSRFVQDTKYQANAGLCPDCSFPLEALKHDPPLSHKYDMSAYIHFCNSCKLVRTNVQRWAD